LPRCASIFSTAEKLSGENRENTNEKWKGNKLMNGDFHKKIETVKW
jgi:hypothetical protein